MLKAFLGGRATLRFRISCALEVSIIVLEAGRAIIDVGLLPCEGIFEAVSCRCLRVIGVRGAAKLGNDELYGQGQAEERYLAIRSGSNTL